VAVGLFCIKIFKTLSLFVFVEVFQAVKGESADKGVAVGDVLLPATGLPVAVLLGGVFTVELSDAVWEGVKCQVFAF